MSFKYIENLDLANYTTFKIGGKADKAYFPENSDDLFDIINTIDFKKDRPLFLGAGSNLLVSSNGYRGTVIITKNMDKIKLINPTTIEAESGVSSPSLTKFCLKNNLTGLEFLIGIPGTIGGALFMNSSANNQCISDNLEILKVINFDTKQLKSYIKEDLRFSYRKLLIDNKKELIISATFKLKEANTELIQQKIDEIINFRKTKQPKGFNAGSIFKNPSKDLSAGLLLDKSCTKGWTEGDAQVTQLHANFINNLGKATSTDVSRLMLRMKNAVKDKTGYIIQPEIKFVGEPTKEEEIIWKNLIV